MAKFEHYLYQGGVRMRCGYTTGSCAALAAKAAARRLLLGENSRTEAIITPSGIRVEVDICALSQDGRSAACGVYKDAGDDIDVTDGYPILRNPASALTAAKGSGGSPEKGWNSRWAPPPLTGCQGR